VWTSKNTVDGCRGILKGAELILQEARRNTFFSVDKWRSCGKNDQTDCDGFISLATIEGLDDEEIQLLWPTSQVFSTWTDMKQHLKAEKAKEIKSEQRIDRVAAMESRKETLIGKLEECDPAVAAGIRDFTQAVTCAHTVHSKRYSIFSLIRENVEPVLSAYLRNHRRQLISYEIRVLVRAQSTGLANEIKRAMRNLEDSGLADAMQTDMRKFEDLLRCYIAPAWCTQWDENFQATLESVRYLCEFCEGAVSIRRVNKSTIKGGETRKTVRPVFDPSQSPYCELCYRLCQSEDQNKSPSDVRVSMRFCIEHDPGSANSQYRTDLNHRKNFHAKLREINAEFPWQPEKWIHLAGDLDQASIRRYAYEFVHARPVDDRLKVIQLSNEGHTNVEIAKILGISRQMVHKILNNPLKRSLGKR
jgi:hypothetical protein